MCHYYLVLWSMFNRKENFSEFPHSSSVQEGLFFSVGSISETDKISGIKVESFVPGHETLS